LATDRHRERLLTAYEKAAKQLQKCSEERTRHLDKKIHDPQINVGDHVYMRNRITGRNKIQDAWNPKLYVVVYVPEDGNPVYTLKSVDDSTSCRAHRSSFRLCRPMFGATSSSSEEPVSEERRDPVIDSDKQEEEEEGVVYYLMEQLPRAPSNLLRVRSSMQEPPTQEAPNSLQRVRSSTQEAAPKPLRRSKRLDMRRTHPLMNLVEVSTSITYV